MSEATLFHGAAQIVTITSSPGLTHLTGAAMGKPEVLTRGAVGLSLLATDVVLAILPDDEMEQWLGEFKPGAAVARVDVTGAALLPGFVDAHSHPVWAGDRVRFPASLWPASEGRPGAPDPRVGGEAGRGHLHGHPQGRRRHPLHGSPDAGRPRGRPPPDLPRLAF